MAFSSGYRNKNCTEIDSYLIKRDEIVKSYLCASIVGQASKIKIYQNIEIEVLRLFRITCYICLVLAAFLACQSIIIYT